MAIYSFASRQYKGILVTYSYSYSPQMVGHSAFGDFNGGTPETLDVCIEDILVEQTSIFDWVSLSVWEGLEEEIAAKIKSDY
jgi:hypothetical protein